MSTVRFDLAKHPTKDTITMLTSLLEKVTKANDHPSDLNGSNINASNGNSNSSSITTASSNNGHRSRSRSLSHASPYTCFHARSIPSISIHAYLSRILKYCPCANECFLALLVYFDRLSKSNYGRQPLRIDSFNIHRLIIAGVMIASKLFSDVFFTNTRYAKVGGLPVAELNVLEVEFLSLNNYSLFVTMEELQHYGDQLLLHWMREQNGYVETRVHPRQLRGDLRNELIPHLPNNEEEEYTARVSKAARQLSIDKGDPRKDMHRKSDEIDRHRTFKRPSFTSSSRKNSQDSTSQHLPTPPESSSPDITSRDHDHPHHNQQQPLLRTEHYVPS
ncbi:cyclin-domain-containing protein [Syncephalastrum racemosum]|uniref:Cyclin-domain-containing protein n=1 Tax=Syncephalastrum racemosum TaxID=13706 RepID=A0A1X2H6Y0_SYNRA|nr:cyclin-domain-containing protein [Syncephalastrum racemosum]